MRNLTKLTSITAVALLMPVATMAGANASTASISSSAAPTAQIEAFDQVQIQAGAPEDGSVFNDVANATTNEERRALLTSEGFERVPGEGERYERTVDGITLGWAIEEQPEPGAIQPMWSVGWSGGPYVAATVSQWQSAASTGTGISALACTFITNFWGGFTCAAAGLAVSEAIDRYDPGAAGSTCMAAQPSGTSVRVFPVSSC